MSLRLSLRSWLVAATLVPVTALAVAAAPEGGTDCRPSETDGAAEVCRTRTYLQCSAELGGKVHHYLLDGMAEFTLDEPATSFTAGGGCGEYDEPAFRTTQQDGVYSWDFFGYVEGNLDTMTVELHNFGFGQGDRATGEVTLPVRLSIDGVSPFGHEEVEGATGEVFQSPITVEIPVVPVASSTGLTVAYRFTITDLGAVLETLEPGISDEERHVVVTIDAPRPNGVHGWVWGASEVPTGIVFNPLEDDDLGTVVRATG